jgi:hypothetical protein
MFYWYKICKLNYTIYNDALIYIKGKEHVERKLRAKMDRLL